MELCYHLTWPVTWLTRTELAWQSLVMTARTEHWWMGVILLGVTHETFITPERVCLSWRVSQTSLHTANNLSSTSVFTQGCCLMPLILMGGGYPVIPKLWLTGEEHLLIARNAHAAGTTLVGNVAIVTKMTQNGVRTAASSLINRLSQSESSDLEM